MPRHILIAPTTFAKVDIKPKEILRSQGLAIIENDKGRKLAMSEVVDLAKKCVGIIAGTERYTDEVLQQLSELKVISRLGVGMDNIDMSYAEQRGIQVYRTTTTPALAAAELTLGLMIDVLRNISSCSQKVKTGQWEKNMGRLASGKTLGIIGLGTIGKALVHLAKGFNFHILAFDICHDNGCSEQYGVNYCNLDTLLREADIVTIHLSLSAETHHIINAARLALLKRDAIIINTSRGEIIDEQALYTALTSGKLGGAGLDVFEEEPYYGKLKELENAILTPHIGAYAREIRMKMEIEAVENLINGLKSVE